jgi:ubiquinone/menaquinone biosynthesis C-methylase UbiE
MDRKANERAHGARIADKAERVWGWGTPAGKRRAFRRAHLLIEFGSLHEGARVLELGCGTGVFTNYFAQTGATIHALDISWDLLRRVAFHGAGHVDLILGDAEELSFPAESFDAVVGSSILHHLNYHHALREAHRVLKTGGRLAFAEPNMLNPQIAIQKNIPFIKKLLGDSPDEGAFVRWTIARVLRKVGFSDVQVFPYDFLHPLVPKSFVSVVERIGMFVERVPVVREIAGSLIITAQKA